VPKFDIILKPGESLPNEFSAILSTRLSPAFRQKLLKHGGLIRLSVASPYVDRKLAKKNPVVVDDVFMKELEAISKDAAALRLRLQPVPVKKLLEICARLQLPVRSQASSREVREAVIQRLQSGHFWQEISGSQQPPPPRTDEKP